MPLQLLLPLVPGPYAEDQRNHNPEPFVTRLFILQFFLSAKKVDPDT